MNIGENLLKEIYVGKYFNDVETRMSEYNKYDTRPEPGLGLPEWFKRTVLP